MKNKAKFLGHCQGCGKQHKVPNGIANHGYTVEDWRFNGVCAGAHKQPYELSCEYIKEILISQEENKAKLLGIIEVAKKPSEGNFAYVLHVVKSRYFPNQSFQLVEIVEEVISFQDGKGSYNLYKYFHKEEGKFVPLFRHDSPRNLEEAKIKLNLVYLRNLEGKLDNLQRYINWQNERVQNWVKRELIEVKE